MKSRVIATLTIIFLLLGNIFGNFSYALENEIQDQIYNDSSQENSEKGIRILDDVQSEILLEVQRNINNPCDSCDSSNNLNEKDIYKSGDVIEEIKKTK